MEVQERPREVVTQIHRLVGYAEDLLHVVAGYEVRHESALSGSSPLYLGVGPAMRQIVS